MRISDWSSDVCSSDFGYQSQPASRKCIAKHPGIIDDLLAVAQEIRLECLMQGHCLGGDDVHERASLRSDARRVGNEGGSTWRSRWTPYTYKKTEWDSEIALRVEITQQADDRHK